MQQSGRSEQHKTHSKETQGEREKEPGLVTFYDIQPQTEWV